MVQDIFYYTHNKYETQRNIERHEIKFHELTFLIDGKMTYYVNDEKFDMVGGDIIYIPAGSLRQRKIHNVPNDYISINFHSIERVPLKSYSRGGINEGVRMLLDYCDFIDSTPTSINPKKMVYILETLILQISSDLESDSLSPVGSRISAYLSRHYSEKISLEDVSRELYFSAAYCESEFKKYMGKSIIQHLIDLRIEEAKKLLADTSMSCSGIAAVVGFDDANYFSRIFKKRTGYSPLRYRVLFG